MLDSFKRYCFSCVVIAPLSAAGEDAVSFDLSAQKMYDSNLTRTPTASADSLVTTTGAIAVYKAFDIQTLNCHWRLSDLNYETRKDLDTVVQEGDVALHSNWTHRLISNIQWTRDTREVDLQEFPTKDIVTRDASNAKIGYGTENHLATYVGFQEIDQRHSNSERESLNYIEQEGYSEADYHTASASNILLFLKSGSRTYSDNSSIADSNSIVTNSVPAKKNLDFNYAEIELDGLWILTPKTQLNMLVASFKRDGDINTATGVLYSLDTIWKPTEKLSIKLGYQLNQPAIGELADTPADEKNISSSIDWQISRKIKFSADITYIKRNYTLESAGNARNETFHRYSPAKIHFAISENIALGFDITLRDNRSPLTYREYHSREATLKLQVHF